MVTEGVEGVFQSPSNKQQCPTHSQRQEIATAMSTIPDGIR